MQNENQGAKRYRGAADCMISNMLLPYVLLPALWPYSHSKSISSLEGCYLLTSASTSSVLRQSLADTLTALSASSSAPAMSDSGVYESLEARRCHPSIDNLLTRLDLASNITTEGKSFGTLTRYV